MLVKAIFLLAYLTLYVSSQTCPTCPEIIPANSGNNCGVNVPSCCYAQFETCPKCRDLTVFQIPQQTPLFQICANSNADCCQTCSCTGDPHCEAFGGAAADWVVCDIRDADCQFKVPKPETKCAATTYQGTSCQWRKDPSGKAFCQFPLSLPPPIMNMYSKEYFSSDGVKYQFKVLLRLSVYGSIGVIQIWDKIPLGSFPATPTYEFSLTYRTKTTPLRCIHPPQFPPISASSSFERYKFTLDSGVQLELHCNKRISAWGTNWDVWSLRDPGFNPDTSEGFCPTGVIAEMGVDANIPSKCQGVDVVLFSGYFRKYLRFGKIGCSPKSKSFVSDCKEKWCEAKVQFPLTDSELNMRNYQLLKFGSSGACQGYVSDPKNYLRAICAASPQNRVLPQDCDADPLCKFCTQDILDYPAAVADNLDPIVVKTQAPTVPCDISAFVQAGFNSPGSIDNGLLVQQFNTVTFAWDPFWAVSNNEISSVTKSCGCVSFSPENSGFGSGLYRVQQCFPSLADLADQCTGNVGFNLTIDCGVSPFTLPPTIQTSSSAPTRSPTSSKPTRSPTDSPSSSKPTASPTTSKPTKGPTNSPSSSKPTGSPSTSKPSNAPTDSPSSSKPTNTPTDSPSTSTETSNPTDSPSSSKPTKAPSDSPSTSKPTSNPTKSPSSSKPTLSPTKSPTKAPIISKPTQAPTDSPSVSVPTKSPTMSAPTPCPTRSPTTSKPSISPTRSRPTKSPTDSPSVSVPTKSPTKSAPTSSPTKSPTTAKPTTAPTSSKPTRSPTDSPIPSG